MRLIIALSSSIYATVHSVVKFQDPFTPLTFFAEPGNLRWLKGEEKVKRFDYPERGLTNAFCIDCGCGVPYLNLRKTDLVVRVGALNGDPCFTTINKIFHGEMPEWNLKAPVSGA